MPLQNLRFTFEQVTGDPADRVVWSFGLDGDPITNANIGTLVTEFSEALRTPVSPYNPLGTTWLPGDLTLILAEAFPAQGGPATAVEVQDEVYGSSSGGPSEVQLCVTRLGMTPRGMAPIGRIYIGPLVGGSKTGTGRPDVMLMDAAGSFCQDFHISRMMTLGYSPAVISKAGTPGAVGLQIDGHRVDNAWDTQRRRGFAPTSTRSFPAN